MRAVLDLIAALHEEARLANERRLLVLTGSHENCLDAVPSLLDALVSSDSERIDRVLVGHRAIGSIERHPPHASDALLGTTRTCVVLDAHEECRPNSIARCVGAVDGGGLLVLLAPPLDSWPNRRDEFDVTLAVPPDDVSAVAGNFRCRLVKLLRAHEGIAIASADSGTVEKTGLTAPEDNQDFRAFSRSPPKTPAPATESDPHTTPAGSRFPEIVYESTRSQDQVRAVKQLERLRESKQAIVVEADRGRGKSSAAGLAAGALAADGRDVLVSAPQFTGERELFDRATELLELLNSIDRSGTTDRAIRTTGGGCVRFEPPSIASDLPADPDAVIVDEAAGLPVSILERFLTTTPVAFVTTVHGYEGAGRGFSVRFRDRLKSSDLNVTDCVMRTPIRYAASDPIERWGFRALLLDARPAVDQLVMDAQPESVTYGREEPDQLIADEHRLRELFGLLVLAHYRTEPDDLARLLDAPNLSVRTLSHDGRVVAVALLAREGGLSEELCERAYRGERIQGNMLPDLFTGQLRDPAGARETGIRVMRIATHPAVRSRGLGSRLLEEIHEEFGDRTSWFGVSYGATPELLRFWRRNGYRMVHLSVGRNETSGEHSAAMLRPSAGSDRSSLYARQTQWFADRIGGMLSDTLRDIDPDVIRAALAATEGSPSRRATNGSPSRRASPGDNSPDLTDREWRIIVSSAYGPGQFDMYPEPFRRLVLAVLSDPADPDGLTAREERLLVRRVLQAHPWEVVTAELEYPSASSCRRNLGRALRPLVERYGARAAADERRRYEERVTENDHE